MVICFPRVVLSEVAWEGERGGNLYNGLTGQAPSERGTFFMLQVYKWVGIFLVYERLGTSVISVCKRAQRASRYTYCEKV